MTSESLYESSNKVENGYVNFVDVFTYDENGTYAKPHAVENDDPRQMEYLKDVKNVLYFVFYRKPIGFIDDIEVLGKPTDFSPYIFMGDRIDENIVLYNGEVIITNNKEDITYNEAIQLYEERKSPELIKCKKH